MDSRPGSSAGSVRWLATAPMKSSKAGATGMPASSSDHLSTETYASSRLDASSVPRAGQATRTTRTTRMSRPRTASARSRSALYCSL